MSDFEIRFNVDTIHQWHAIYTSFTVCLCQPVDMYPANSLGFHDVRGNVWQWMEDHMTALMPFHTSYLYDDYSTSFFDGRHNVIAVSLLIKIYIRDKTMVY